MSRKMEKKPEISVIMSVYNETPNGIKKAVESITIQTFSNFEFIIVNDNPKDLNTKKTLKSILQQDNRIKIITNEINKGLGYSLNRAVQSSKAEIIARMDTEDKSKPERLNKQLLYMKSNKQTDLLFTQWYDINEHSQVTAQRPSKKDFINIKKSFFTKSLLMHPTLMVRKKVLLENPYPEMQRPEDIVLWLKLIRKGYVFDILEEQLYMYNVDRINVLRRCLKTRVASKNLIPHLIFEFKHYWRNGYFWLYFVRIIFEYLVSRNCTIFNLTHARAVQTWKKFFKLN